VLVAVALIASACRDKAAVAEGEAIPLLTPSSEARPALTDDSRPPVDEGTAPPPPTSDVAAPVEQCDPHYDASACVPIDSDVDCAGGRGNGPSYVQGPVAVIGRDVYGLDRDGDGVGCEN
jgi:hypothetical protein